MTKIAVIIGAGPAGLTAARYLQKETDVHPLILEESDAIGGISRTVNYHGNRMDLGGHRFFSKNDEVNAFWAELLPLQGAPAWDDKLLGRDKPLMEGGPDPETTDRVMLVRDRVSRIYYLRKFFDYPISLKFQTFRNMGFRRTVQAGCGYLYSCVHKRPENSLKDFMINRFGKPLYGMFFESYNEKVWGRNPKDIAPDWGAQRIKGLSLSKAVREMLKKAFGGGKNEGKQVETSLIEQYVYPKRGPGQLWELLADEIVRDGGELRKNCAVTRLFVEDGRITGVAVSGGTERIDADYVFSTMPIKDLIAAMDTEVPKNVAEVAAGLPYRDFITVGLLVDRMKLKNETKRKTVGDIVPDCWIYIQEPDVHMGRIQIFNNWSPYMVKDPKNSVFIGLEYFCNEGDALWEMSDADFIKMASEELVRMQIVDADAILDGCRLRIKKAYPAYFDSYARFDEVKTYLNGFTNLYCIGRNGQHRYNNMDHSMLTAMEAVRSLKNGTDKAAVWQVNTEESYHEAKGEKA